MKPRFYPLELWGRVALTRARNAGSRKEIPGI